MRGVGGKEYPKRLLVPNGTKDMVVNIQEIEWIEAADYYSLPTRWGEELHVAGDSQAVG